MKERPFDIELVDADEATELIPQHIVTQKQLNEWEQSNILLAEQWVSQQQFDVADVVTFDFVKHLHGRMFDKTWRWAGEFRQTNKNLGVDWLMVAVELRKLMDDLQYQITHAVFEIDELVARFHHRLVAIHPFPNGNGRHGRMMADIVLLSLGAARFTWGGQCQSDAALVRRRYIEALCAADQSGYERLIQFVRD